MPFIAKQEEISNSYKELAKKYHPDVACDTEIFTGITEAYNVLKDKDRRKKYNIELKFKYINCQRCKGTGKTYKQKGFLSKEYCECDMCNGLGLVRKHDI